MDKSVAQKLMIVMSMFVAVFATVFVCGNIVNGSVSSDSYRQPIPKTNYDVSYTDAAIQETPGDIAGVSATDALGVTEPVTHFEGNVTVVEFIDDEESDVIRETSSSPEENIDEQFLYMTTVTTRSFVTKQTTATTSVNAVSPNRTTKRTTVKTTAKSTVTAAQPAATTTATVKTTKETEKTTVTSSTTSAAATVSTVSTTKATTTPVATSQAVNATTAVTTTASTASTTSMHTAVPTTSAMTTNQTKSSAAVSSAAQIAGSVSVSHTTTHSTTASAIEE